MAPPYVLKTIVGCNLLFRAGSLPCAFQEGRTTWLDLSIKITSGVRYTYKAAAFSEMKTENLRLKAVPFLIAMFYVK
jgi:hypothetical protein